MNSNSIKIQLDSSRHVADFVSDFPSQFPTCFRHFDLVSDSALNHFITHFPGPLIGVLFRWFSELARFDKYQVITLSPSRTPWTSILEITGIMEIIKIITITILMAIIEVVEIKHEVIEQNSIHRFAPGSNSNWAGSRLGWLVQMKLKKALWALS